MKNRPFCFYLFRTVDGCTLDIIFVQLTAGSLLFFIGDKKVRGKFAFVSHFERRGKTRLGKLFRRKERPPTGHSVKRRRSEFFWCSLLFPVYNKMEEQKKELPSQNALRHQKKRPFIRSPPFPGKSFPRLFANSFPYHFSSSSAEIPKSPKFASQKQVFFRSRLHLSNP